MKKKICRKKRLPNSTERIERAKKFPIKEPVQIISESTDWSKKYSPSKQYPGSASFILNS